MQQISEADKQLAAIILMCGLFFVMAKAVYENVKKERLTLFNLLHPVKKITAKERQFISQFLQPFHILNSDQRRTFLERFAWFKSKKPFIFYGNIENKEEIKAYVTASAVLLTLGMNNYRFEKSIVRVIIYPSKYYSKISRRHHIGEYNPRLRTLVFSAEGLKDGFGIPNDNVNLGVHEVAHALMIETLRKPSFEAKSFQVGLAKIKELFESDAFSERLSQSTYFREYGQTNFVEFFAVITENFVETPQMFKQDFPDLYEIVRRMYNFDLNDTGWNLRS
ncbi:zinc-dependent peptidase [Flagellimonas pelagia]|uniref:Zinc-dependent peptidase n=1 Tax=Flagellimonas pelagia TaxID=2306998 RepID=A0A3A1NNK5_9FLAO|nr:zinc-dependent peptidase [Allomuricauda maritima]RIV46844.1 hypothetical protein D2V05_02475 [Allomuricauda maritima]TXJ99730.1 zinc-dependent peptidase [Allomuricauda maritima]